MILRDRIKNVIAAMLVITFTTYLGNATMFPHRHEANGIIFSHSHPFSGSADNPNHTHSQAQLDTIAYLTAMLFTALIMAGMVFSAGIFFHVYHIPSPCRVSREAHGTYSLRAPPSYAFG